MARTKADLTVTAVQKLQLPKDGHRVDVPDGRVPGLMVRVGKRGKSWGLWWRFPARLGKAGKGFHTLGPVEKPPKLSEARDRAREILEAVSNGIRPEEHVRGQLRAQERAVEERRGLTIERLVTEHLAARAGRLAPATLTEYRNSLKTYIRGTRVGQMPITEAKRADIREWLRELSRERGPSISRRVLSLLKGASRWATAEDRIPHDVLSVLQLENRRPARDRVLEDGELRALWLALEDVPPLIAARVRLCILTAARPGEPLGMEWGDLGTAHVERGSLRDTEEIPTWHIPAAKRKHGIEHTVPLAPLAVDVIESMRPVNGKAKLVLAGLDVSLGWYWWKKVRKRVLEETGAANFTQHDLRRSTSTGLQRLGVPDHIVDAVLGHVQRGTRRPYLRYQYLREKHDALSRWAEHIDGLVAKPGRVVGFRSPREGVAP